MNINPPQGMTKHIANRIYDTLVVHCDAPDTRLDRLQCCAHILQEFGRLEYRFQGSLGFGGKLWMNRDWYVSCYPEDQTPERDTAVTAANAALDELRRRFNYQELCEAPETINPEDA